MMVFFEHVEYIAKNVYEAHPCLREYIVNHTYIPKIAKNAYFLWPGKYFIKKKQTH